MTEWAFWRRRSGRAPAGNPYALDTLIAVGFGLFALGAFFTAERTPHATNEPDVLGAVLVLLAAGAVAFRRKWPVGVLVVVSASALSMHLLGYPDGGLPFAVVIALYTLASLRGRWIVISATVVLLVTVPISFWATDTVDDSGTLVGTLAVFVLADRHVTDRFDRKVFVKVDPTVPAAQSRAALDGALATWPNASLQDRAGFERSIAEPIDALLNLVYGLPALAVLIALIGIANTLALSVHERKREVGLLRAIGMQRRQVRRAVRRESLLIAVLGTALGAVLAVGGAWAIVRALKDQGVTHFIVPGGQLAIILAVACLAGVLAAAGPARRAAKLNVLDAIATE